MAPSVVYDHTPNDPTRTICWPTPKEVCLRGECSECHRSTRLITFDDLEWMNNQLGYEISKKDLTESMEAFSGSQVRSAPRLRP